MLNSLDAFVNPSAKALRGLLWALLKRCEPLLTREQAGSFLNRRNMAAVRLAIAKAFMACLPPPEKKGKKSEQELDLSKPMSFPETWAEGRFELGLSDEEWLAMTPRQFHYLRKSAVKTVRHFELIAGQLGAAIKNHSMNPPKKCAQARDFLLHKFEEDELKTGGGRVDMSTGAISFQA